MTHNINIFRDMEWKEEQERKRREKIRKNIKKRFREDGLQFYDDLYKAYAYASWKTDDYLWLDAYNVLDKAWHILEAAGEFEKDVDSKSLVGAMIENPFYDLVASKKIRVAPLVGYFFKNFGVEPIPTNTILRSKLEKYKKRLETKQKTERNKQKIRVLEAAIGHINEVEKTEEGHKEPSSDEVAKMLVLNPQYKDSYFGHSVTERLMTEFFQAFKPSKPWERINFLVKRLQAQKNAINVYSGDVYKHKKQVLEEALCVLNGKGGHNVDTLWETVSNNPLYKYSYFNNSETGRLIGEVLEIYGKRFTAQDSLLSEIQYHFTQVSQTKDEKHQQKAAVLKAARDILQGASASLDTLNESLEKNPRFKEAFLKSRTEDLIEQTYESLKLDKDLIKALQKHYNTLKNKKDERSVQKAKVLKEAIKALHSETPDTTTLERMTYENPLYNKAFFTSHTESLVQEVLSKYQPRRPLSPEKKLIFKMKGHLNLLNKQKGQKHNKQEIAVLDAAIRVLNNEEGHSIHTLQEVLDKNPHFHKVGTKSLTGFYLDEVFEWRCSRASFYNIVRHRYELAKEGRSQEDQQKANFFREALRVFAKEDGHSGETLRQVLLENPLCYDDYQSQNTLVHRIFNHFQNQKPLTELEMITGEINYQCQRAKEGSSQAGVLQETLSVLNQEQGHSPDTLFQMIGQNQGFKTNLKIKSLVGKSLSIFAADKPLKERLAIKVKGFLSELTGKDKVSGAQREILQEAEKVLLEEKPDTNLILRKTYQSPDYSKGKSGQAISALIGDILRAYPAKDSITPEEKLIFDIERHLASLESKKGLKHEDKRAVLKAALAALKREGNSDLITLQDAIKGHKRYGEAFFASKTEALVKQAADVLRMSKPTSGPSK